jgi:aminopeptidase N
VDQTVLAAEVGPQILEFFERHYNVPFPLPKMDMIAIPDFGSGAMENWGLITYRETALLYKEGESSISDREGIVATIAHELAHQWFGNLVTMEWWTE